MEIRSIVEAADRRMAQTEIYAALKENQPNRNLFCVTIADMLRGKQLSRRKANKRVHELTGARFVYGPGRNPVSNERSEQPKRIVGFMERRRMLDARARKRAA